MPGDCKRWQPRFGPLIENVGGATRCLFRLLARKDAQVELVLEGQATPRSIKMHLAADGLFEIWVDGEGAGTLYWFKIDGAGPYPDPASRLQPLGVHGPSQVVDTNTFHWEKIDFHAPSLRELVVYELHIGTFTPEGTFLAAIAKLDILKELGVTAIELMPIADFAGERNWGYDGVFPYAPAHCYGTPDDLRALVQEAHRRGLAVLLDVVYNHLGPDGAYQAAFAPQFYSKKHCTPWGDGLNFDGEGCKPVRDYFIESALAWVYDYRIDGLRADATHAIHDDSTPHFLAELTQRLHEAAAELGRPVLMIAEDDRNERKLIEPRHEKGYGFDAVWSDDFHHHSRHRLAGDCDGYYCDFDGTTESIAKTVEDGWFFHGQFSEHAKHDRGTSADGLTLESRLICIQNHDQIGNRAFGERLSSQISPAAYRAASALLLLAPETPLLFMGQEWAADEPFLYFTDHNEELGQLVTEGRRKEFEHFAAFADESQRDRIPDPQAKETFLRSKLDWAARTRPGHAACWNWYRTLLQIRRYLVRNATFSSCRALDDHALSVRWKSSTGNFILVVALDGPCAVHENSWKGMNAALMSEDNTDADWQPDAGELRFQCAGAALLATADAVVSLGACLGDGATALQPAMPQPATEPA